MVPAMHSRSYPRFKITSWERGAVVARLLVALLGVAEDVGRVDLLGPLACADLLQGDRHRLFAVTSASATMAPDATMSSVKPSNTERRSIRLVSPETRRLVKTAKTPEIEMAWPAWPSVR